MIMMIVKRLQNQMLEHNGIVNKFIILVCLLSWWSLVSAADPPSCTQMGTIIWFLMFSLCLYSSAMFILVAHSLWYFWHSKTVSFFVPDYFFYLDLSYHNAVFTAIFHSIEENLCSWHGVLLFYPPPHYFSFFKAAVAKFLDSSAGDFFFLERMERAFLSLSCRRYICIFLILCALWVLQLLYHLSYFLN